MKKCTSCGAEALDQARFCSQCGAVLPEQAAPSEQAMVPVAEVVGPAAGESQAHASANFSGVGEPPTSSLAIVSLISGILGWFGLPCIGAAGAVVTGHLARKEIAESQGKKGGRGLATAGLILGYSQVVLLCLALTALSALFAVGGHLKDSLMQVLDEARHGQKVEEGPPTDEDAYPDESPEGVDEPDDAEVDPDADEGADRGDLPPGRDEPEGLPEGGRPGRGAEKAY